MASKYRVLLTDPIWPSLEPEHQVLDSIGAEMVVSPSGSAEELCRQAPDVDAMLVCYGRVSREVLAAGARLRIVARYGIGYDTIDVPAATERGVVVTNVPGYCTDEVSDHALALILALARKLTVYDRAVRVGGWDAQVGKPIQRLRGQTVGLIGLGRIGSAVARKAAAFGLRILAYDPFLSAEQARERGAERVDLATLLRESDFVSLHAPLSRADGTTGMFGAAQFQQMKRGAYLINTARGGLVDGQALEQALGEGLIAGAGLDCLPVEPPSLESPLLRAENVILSPHAAFYSEQAMVDSQRLAAEEVARVLTGQRPLSPVNPEALENRKK
ncbi:MAG: C-terminal binding protein [Chloroflexota bacterium]